MYRYGFIASKSDLPKKMNYVYVDGPVTYLFTDKLKRIVIDTSDYDKVKGRYWTFNSQGYVITVENKKHIRLHRVLMNPPDGKVVDHINRIKCDNRKSNLRICNQRLNTYNASIKKNNVSGQTGVSKIKTTGKFRARIFVDGREKNLGHYESFEEAVTARIKAEKQYFGDFAPSITKNI